MVITTTLSVYYLPKLSSLKNPLLLRYEIFKTCQIVIPIALLCSFIIYSSRDLLILMLFDEQFEQMEQLFFWQMVGDSLKISSWLFGYVLTAKAMVGLYVLSELIFSGVFYLVTVYFTSQYGLEGVSIAHAFTYLLHLFFMVLILKLKRII